MELTFSFIKIFAISAFYLSPLLVLLLAMVVVLGLWVGRVEGWSRFDSIYYSFVTATTVGYGDFRPTHRKTKVVAIVIALLGLLTTGIVVSIGLMAVKEAFALHHDADAIRERFAPESSVGALNLPNFRA